MTSLLPYDTVRAIVEFLPWMEQIEILPELKSILLPEIEKKSNAIKRAMKQSKIRILSGIDQEYPDAKLMRVALCLYRLSDSHRVSDITKVIRHPTYFSRKVMEVVELGHFLKWSTKKTHRHMIEQMTDAEVETAGW
jgi:hypothetical protein